MSDQPTPEPDDPTVADDALPKKDRDAIRDVAKALADGSLRMDSDEYQALSPRVRRRAWLRYQAANEDTEKVRERNARERAASENEQATVEIARHAERLRDADDRPQRPGMAVQHADGSP
jgi:hypothetical protein